MNDKEIRFIDSNYKELFRIPDGGKINITLNDGEQLTRQCKYIDDYHFKLSEVDSNYGNVYHICQFAELMESNKNTYEPVREDSRYRDIKFVEETYGTITEDKFFKTDGGITEVYYNPDANSGGQLVYIEASDDIIREAAEKFKKPADFFSHIEGMGRGYLIDVGTPEFRGNLESFMNRKADFDGCTKKTMDGLKKSVGIMPTKSRKHSDMER